MATIVKLCYLKVKTSCFVCDFSLGFIIFALHSVRGLHLPGFGVVFIKNIVMRKILLLIYLLLFSCVVALAQEIEGPIPTALVVDSKGELHRKS